MLNETVKVPKILTISMVTRKATDVHAMPKNNSHKRSLMVMLNNSALSSP